MDNIDSRIWLTGNARLPPYGRSAPTAAPGATRPTNDGTPAGPLPLLRLALQSPAQAPVHCLTDLSGRCLFPTLPAGQFNSASKEGFCVVELHRQVAPGSAIDVSISPSETVKWSMCRSPPAIDPAKFRRSKRSAALKSSTSLSRHARLSQRPNFSPGVVQTKRANPTSSEPRPIRPSPCSTGSTSLNLPTGNSSSTSVPTPSAPFRSRPRASLPSPAKDRAAF